jgi:photosystem II stability/assembly factor-like uncharacterized protein
MGTKTTMNVPFAFGIASMLLLIGCGTTTTTVTPGSWQTMRGPHAQDVTALLVTNEPALALLAGTDNGDVYGTDNPAAAWEQIGTIRKGARILQFIRDPEKTATFYAATDSGLFVSQNQGASWTGIPVLSDGTPPVDVRSLAIDPWNPLVVYAGTAHQGIRRSSDGGVTWNRANDGIPGLDSADVREILIDLSKPDRVLAAVSPFGVVQSNDAGKSWSKLTEEFTTTGSSVTHLAQNPRTPATIVYGTDAGSLRKSTDHGTTWSPSRNGFTEGRILSLSTVRDRPEMLLAGTESGIIMSHDFGTSWTDITGGLPHLPVGVASSADGQTIYAFGEGIGLERTSDIGATWTHVDNKLGGATIRFLTADEKGRHLYAALEHAVLAYDSATGSWESASSGLPGGTITSIVVDSDSPLHLIAATTLGGFQSTDGGESWQLASRNMRVTPKLLDPHPRIHTRMLASGSLGLDVSTDKGTTWRQTKPFSSRFHVSAFTYSPRNTGVIYGAAPQAVIMSKDGGFAWESSRYGLHGEDIAAITLDNRDAAVVYAWTSTGGGYRSLDGGLEWNKYAPPWKQTDTVLIAFDRFEPSSVVALVNGKQIYYSPSGGGTWFALHSLALNLPAQSLWWNASKRILFLGTRGKGVQRISLEESVKDVAGDREGANDQ